MTSRALSLLASLTLLVACGSTSAATDAGVDVGGDAGALVLDAGGGFEGGVVPDAGLDDSGSSDGGVTPGTAVDLTYRTATGTFDRAFLGYHRTAGTIDGLYYEVSRGADDACPSPTSPVPSQLFTIEGFPGASPATRTEADGVIVRFFDFEGLFRTEIAPDVATVARVEVTALDETAGTAAASLELTFGSEGHATGTLTATHCDSLDTAD